MATILFVDDQIDEFRSLLLVVRNFLPEVEILTADNGNKGFALAKEYLPAMIFLDISMPGQDGYEVCRMLKADPATASIPILFLSSLDLDLQGQMDALDLGATDFLRKPIHSIELALRIKVMLRLNEYTNHLEELVEAQTEKIEQQRMIATRTERLAAMGTLAAGIAHEINQPLNALKVTADSLLYWHNHDQPFDEQEIIEGVQFITEQAERIDDIVKHMRDLVRQDKTTTSTAVNFKTIVERALSLVGQQLHSHSIELKYDYDENVPDIYGHPTEIEQVVINLLTNAMQALDKVERDSKRIVLTIQRDGKQGVLRVRDNGPGIPADLHDRIFDAFFSIDETAQGMGLGLSITQNLVAGMNGSVIVENNDPEPGTCFSVYLPCVE